MADKVKMLSQDHMLASKNGRVVVVGGREEHEELQKQGGWQFKVYTPKMSTAKR